MTDTPHQPSPHGAETGSPLLRHVRGIAPIVIALLTFITFWPSLGNGFVDWDDTVEVVANPHIESLSPQSLKWMFTNFEWVRRYQPLDWVSWAINYQIHGRAPFGYHLGNVLQHIAGALLLYYFILRLLRIWAADPRRRTTPVPAGVLEICAALGALWWAIHPLRAEPVAWVTGRIYTQCAMFLFAFFLAYLYAQDESLTRKRRRILYWLSLVFWVCALLSYSIVVGAAVALLLLDFYPLNRFPEIPAKSSGKGRKKNDKTPDDSARGTLSTLLARFWNSQARRVYLEKIPFVLAALAIGIITIIARINASGVWDPPPTLAQFGVFPRIMQAFYTWAYFLWIPFQPFNLSPVYTRLVNFNPTDNVFFISVFIVAGLTFVTWILRKHYPALIVLWGYHLIMLVPLLGLSERPHYTSDRYNHMAGITVPILLGGLLAWTFLKAGRSRFFAASAAALLFILPFAMLCYQQTTVWKDSETLFKHMLVELGNDNYRRDIYPRLVRHYADSGRIADATAAATEYLKVDPHFPPAMTCLLQVAVDGQKRGLPDGSVRQLFINAGKLLDGVAAQPETPAPQKAEAFIGAGFAYEQLAMRDIALNRYQLAANIQPNNPMIRLQIARLSHQMGNAKLAMEQLDIAIQLVPDLKSKREQIIAEWGVPVTQPTTQGVSVPR
jgi:tetratricopeptide (TPR) repeat protein